MAVLQICPRRAQPRSEWATVDPAPLGHLLDQLTGDPAVSPPLPGTQRCMLGNLPSPSSWGRLFWSKPDASSAPALGTGDHSFRPCSGEQLQPVRETSRTLNPSLDEMLITSAQSTSTATSEICPGLFSREVSADGRV